MGVHQITPGLADFLEIQNLQKLLNWITVYHRKQRKTKASKEKGIYIAESMRKQIASYPLPVKIHG